MEPTFTRSEIETYLELIYYDEDLRELHDLFFSQLKRYALVDVWAIVELIRKKKQRFLLL